MIYLDNAATTKYKPEEVYEAYNYYVREIGVSPGRGSYQLGIQASRMLYKSRTTIGRFFGLIEPENVIFTKNSTEAINLFFRGFLQKCDHVIISCYEHNAVLRPIEKLKREGIIEYSVISRNDLDLRPELLYLKYVKKNTRLIAMTLASNLTGRVVFNQDVLAYFKSNGISTFVDASQGGGKIVIDMNKQNIDYLAFTGHKDLYAMPGVGGLCCVNKIQFNPLIQGGTGIYGEEYVNPLIFPEEYEAGTINMPAIWSLQEGIKYINNNRHYISKTENGLMTYLVKMLSELTNVVIYDYGKNRVSTCCFNIKNNKSSEVIEFLDKKDICCRGGIHCSILAHQAIGTVDTGAVRISLDYNNTFEEINKLIEVLNEM